jgi:hypothetical protein
MKSEERRARNEEEEAIVVQVAATVPALFAPRASFFALPKAGNSAEEYEDAWATSEIAEAAPGTFACAVADGATETSFSGLWARLLTAAYCAGVDTPDALFDVLPLMQEEWRRAVDAIPLPWYAEEKARRGAFAALTGLTLVAPEVPESDDAEGGSWTALASGDSCLFQVRDDDLIAACPLMCSGDFTNRPTLLSSDPASNDALAETLVYVGGSWLPGDTFYLLTDALACWFLASFEAGDRPWHILNAFLDADTGADAEADFAAWIADLRAARTLRNDDVTLVGVRV